MCGLAPALQRLRQPWPRGGYPVARGGVCPTRGDGDGPLAAHACAARRRPSAGRGQGGAITSREAGCARLAAMVTGRWRHTHVRPGAGPQPTVAEGVLSRRASGMGRARSAAMVTGLWRHKHVRPGAGPQPAVAEGGLSRRASGMGRARLAAMVTGLWRHTHVQLGAGPPAPPPAVAEGGLSHCARRGVPDSRRW
jgi:hypothetical protein